MTVHLISVGVNLVEALDRGLDRFGTFGRAVGRDSEGLLGLCSLGDDAAAASSQLTEWFGPGATPPPHLVDLADRTTPGQWPAEVSAELQTFRDAGGGRLLAGTDVAVLVATDTVDGLLAAMWNATALTGTPNRVRYLPSPDCPLPDSPGSAVIVRVPGMDARSEDGFRTAMRGLGTLGCQLLPMLQPEQECRFYLSGGFKAAIPYLIGLAEALRSRHPPVTAYVLHETSRSSAIRLPLRRLREEVVTSELGNFDSTGRCFGTPGGEVLDGYAYERDRPGGPYTITAFGEGLLAMFGKPPTSIGG